MSNVINLLLSVLYKTVVILCFRFGDGICWNAETRTAYHLHQFLFRHGRRGGRGRGSRGVWNSVWFFVHMVLNSFFYNISDLMLHTCFTVGGRRQWPPPISICSPCTQVQGRRKEQRWPTQFMERLPTEGTPCKMEARLHPFECFTWARLLW